MTGFKNDIGSNHVQTNGQAMPDTPLRSLDNSFSKKFPCPKCLCAYRRKDSLNRHLTYECGKDPRFKCPHCEKRSKQAGDIYAHCRRRHKDYKVYAIDIGQDSVQFFMTGFNNYIGSNHVQTNGQAMPDTPLRSLDNSFNKKKFPCPKCTSAYSTKSSLKRHLTYHCGQDPRFKCPYCEKRCKLAWDIYKHCQRKHTGSDVYAIDIVKSY